MKRTAGAIALLGLLDSLDARSPAPRIQHPNLLINRAELEQVRAKIQREPWAANLLGRVKQLADEPGRTPREAALMRK
jgi:hypothetical protein